MVLKQEGCLSRAHRLRTLSLMNDHPDFEKTATPSRVTLSMSQQEVIRVGEAVDISLDSQKKLKVFDVEDNQLRTEDVARISVACFNCGEDGEYIIAQTHVPHFRVVEIMSFSCDECGYSSRKGSYLVSSSLVSLLVHCTFLF